jgi:uncharacterized protein (DUF2235 family)
MAKNIVVCFDGTANSPTRFDTNVVKMFHLLKGEKDNIVYYDPGVGTLPEPGRLSLLRFKFRRLLGLVAGHGLVDNVVEAYEFVCQNYSDNARLFLIGFSRGSFSARLLASIIHQIGILERHQGNLINYAVNLALTNREKAKAFSEKLDIRKGEIESLALFDTVKSALFGVDAGWSPVQVSVPFTWHNPSVKAVYHAMAIDEKRAMFPVNRWAEPHTHHLLVPINQVVEQVWFAGEHCDIGGSHTTDGLDLSVCALEWMVRQLRGRKLPMAGLCPAWERLAKDHSELAKKSCNGFPSRWWWCLEPMPTFSANEDDRQRFWLMHLARGREIPFARRRPKVHNSVRVRMEQGRDHRGNPYRPEHLRHRRYDEVDWVT